MRRQGPSSPPNAHLSSSQISSALQSYHRASSRPSVGLYPTVIRENGNDTVTRYPLLSVFQYAAKSCGSRTLRKGVGELHSPGDLGDRAQAPAPFTSYATLAREAGETRGLSIIVSVKWMIIMSALRELNILELDPGSRLPQGMPLVHRLLVYNLGHFT